MASIQDKLFETEKQLEGLVTASGDTLPDPGERTDIVSHLDYTIALLGTMVSEEVYKAALKKQAEGYNAIADRIVTINELLSSGEISGDVDLDPLTITENGEYNPGMGKGFSLVTVNTPEDQSTGIIDGTVSSITNNAVKYIHSNMFSLHYSYLTDVDFPACIDIRSSAFYSCNSLTSVSFPACTKIAYSAFGNCSSLTSLFFPVCEVIGMNAFYSCNSLTSVSFPACTSIGSSAFYSCNSLTSVSFPACTSIGSSAFYNCKSLTSVSFPACTIIGSSAFGNCSSLTSLFFPACEVIGMNAFYSCKSLTSVSFPACTIIGSSAFGNCNSLTSVDFPACTSIGSSAFYNCTNLTIASFPKCTRIGLGAFNNCSNLYSVYLLESRKCDLINYNIFSGTPISTSYSGSYGSIYVPTSLYSSYVNDTYWSYYSARFVSVE